MLPGTGTKANFHVISTIGLTEFSMVEKKEKKKSQEDRERGKRIIQVYKMKVELVIIS